MPKITLTDAAVKRLKAPAIGQIDYFDSGYPGLALRVSCGGRKSWNYIYRFAGKPRRMTFYTFPAMTLAGAHEHGGKPVMMFAPVSILQSLKHPKRRLTSAPFSRNGCSEIRQGRSRRGTFVSAWSAKSFICGRI